MQGLLSKKKEKKVDKSVHYRPKSGALKKKKKRKTKKIDVKEYKYFITGVFGFILLILCITLIANILGSPKFHVSEYEFIGNKSISDELLLSTLESFSGKPIFFLDRNNVETKLSESFVFFDKVKTTKQYPNKVVVRIDEREPKIVLINLSGAYLIDEDGRIIDIISKEKINFSSDQLDIINGLGDPTGILVRTRMKVDSEKPENFHFNKIPLKEKIETLEKIRNELLDKVTSNFEKFSKEVSETKYKTMQQVLSYGNDTYDLFDFINIDLMGLSLEVVQYFSDPEGLQIKTITWEGPFLLKCEMKNNKALIFGIKRNISEQLEDYSLINNRLKKEGIDYTQIDLSSVKVSVK